MIFDYTSISIGYQIAYWHYRQHWHIFCHATVFWVPHLVKNSCYPNNKETHFWWVHPYRKWGNPTARCLSRNPVLYSKYGHVIDTKPQHTGVPILRITVMVILSWSQNNKGKRILWMHNKGMFGVMCTSVAKDVSVSLYINMYKETRSFYRLGCAIWIRISHSPPILVQPDLPLFLSDITK